jgi:hypothetical protein
MAETARAKGGARMKSENYQIDYIIYNNPAFVKTIFADTLEDAQWKKSMLDRLNHVSKVTITYLGGDQMNYCENCHDDINIRQYCHTCYSQIEEQNNRLVMDESQVYNILMAHGVDYITIQECVQAIRAEARAEALREAADCTGCWLDDGKRHHGCLPCRRGDKPDLYKTIAAITQEPQE